MITDEALQEIRAAVELAEGQLEVKDRVYLLRDILLLLIEEIDRLRSEPAKVIAAPTSSGIMPAPYGGPAQIIQQGAPPMPLSQGSLKPTEQVSHAAPMAPATSTPHPTIAATLHNEAPQVLQPRAAWARQQLPSSGEK